MMISFSYYRRLIVDWPAMWMRSHEVETRLIVIIYCTFQCHFLLNVPFLYWKKITGQRHSSATSLPSASGFRSPHMVCSHLLKPCQALDSRVNIRWCAQNDVIASISRFVSLTNASRLLLRSMRWFASLVFGRSTAEWRLGWARDSGWEPVKQKFKEHRFGLLPLLKLFSHRTLPSRTQWRRIISRGKRICGPPAKGARSKVKGSTFKNRSELDQYWISAYKLGVL